MIVTYENCNKKEEYTYTISYTGEATSIEVYYEPNADLVLQFKNEDGIMVDNGNLYDGEYTIYYALRDNITGGYVDSPLIGTPKYSGEITINGSAEPLRNEGTASEGKNGKQTIHLSADDQFSAIVEVEYLSGYKSKKTLKDFGWDSDPITISSRVPGELRLELSGTGKTYYIPTLEQGDPVEARVYYEGRLLTGDELESVVITWAESLSGAYLDKVFCGDHYDIIFSHKTDNPTDTIPGESNFPMKALYKPDGCIEAESEPVDFYYTIEDCESALSSDLSIPSKYICISELDESKEIKIDLLLNGQKLSEEQMSRTSLVLDTGGIEYTVKPDDSGYLVKLRKTEGIKSGKYEIKYSASYEDEIGRVSVTEDKGKLELGVLQPWVKWAIALAGLLLLAIIIFLICRIKALPTKIQSRKSDSNLSVDGEDVSKNAGFSSHVSKSGFETYVSYAGKKFGLRANVRPAKDSYLATPQKKRKADADGASVQKFGATILEATIGTARFVLNEETRKFEQTPPSKKPFTIRNGQTIRYSGIINSSGVDRQFSVSTRLGTKK